MLRDLFGRRHHGELATPEDGLACFPIRSASDATLHGVEIRSWPADIDFDRASRQDCPLLDVDQLECVLSESLADRVMPVHRAQICIPVSIRALSRPWVITWIGSRLKDRGEYARMLTFAFSQSEALLDPEGLAACIELLAACSTRAALTEVSDLRASHLCPARARMHVAEVRLAVTCTDAPAALLVYAKRLHREGTTISIVDLNTTHQCEVAIEAGVDALQGDLIGRPFSLPRLEAVLLETLPGAVHGDFGNGYGGLGRT